MSKPRSIRHVSRTFEIWQVTETAAGRIVLQEPEQLFPATDSEAAAVAALQEAGGEVAGCYVVLPVYTVAEAGT